MSGHVPSRPQDEKVSADSDLAVQIPETEQPGADATTVKNPLDEPTPEEVFEAASKKSAPKPKSD